MSSLRRANLRTRLTLLYASLLAVGLLLYAVGVSAFFLRNLREELDSSLHRDVETVEGALLAAPDGTLQISSREGEAEEGELEHGYFLEVWSQQGSLIYHSAQLRNQVLGLPPGKGAGFSRQDPHSIRLPSGMRLRTISRLHHMAVGNPVVVRLAVSEEPLWREFWEMVTVLGFGLPLTVIAVALTGYLVAARALKPVDAMAQHAAQITAEQLNERLQIENPNDELGQLGVAFNATLARLERSFDQLRKFTADASHELRTPLTAIQSVGEVSLQMHGDVRYYRNTIGSMLEETNRLAALVDNLLTMARADAGRMQLQRAQVNLLDLATETVKFLEVLAEERHQAIRIDGTGELTVAADRTVLRQALVNVVHNAVKYSPDGGEVRVRIRETESDAIVEVQDNGPGIPMEHRDRIFERFYRVDKSRTRAAGGAGLGLSIAAWAVSMHGGRIEVVCEPGPGSTFRIRLPKILPAVAPAGYSNS
ncbi:MAG TPA: heavy metal sensor histidine kinase [Acidisarcina sp.]|nr:heavy metal sensor histidine kinase [Acidisarcina sp.]